MPAGVVDGRRSPPRSVRQHVVGQLAGLPGLPDPPRHPHGASPGSYLLHRDDSFGDVRAVLAAGPDVVARARSCPGYTIGEVATQVGQVAGTRPRSHFLALADSGTVRSPFEPAGSTNLDGLVGTGTYLVVPGESDQTLLEDMIAPLRHAGRPVGLTTGAAALGVTPYQAITVASIVEKEGVYQKNLGKVARVIYNRLARGTPLQMDSTVLYSEHRDGGTVTPADLQLNTPYNTYLHTGLTPTPICFPSTAVAARPPWHPTPGAWLYFVVVSKDGTEAFSDTFAGQQANERSGPEPGPGLGTVAPAGEPSRSSPTWPIGRLDRRRGDRRPHRPLAVAAVAQRRLRRPRSRLGVGGVPGRAGATADAP